MIAVGHTAIGVIVGVTAYHFLGQGNLVSGLIVAGSAGVVSHYIADFIPHGHFFTEDKFKKYIVPIIIFDLFLPIVLLLGISYLQSGFGEKLLYVMFGIGGAQLPDVVGGLVLSGMIKAKGWLKLENRFHERLHWHGTGSKALLLGLLDSWQILMVLIALYLVIFN